MLPCSHCQGSPHKGSMASIDIMPLCCLGPKPHCWLAPQCLCYPATQSISAPLPVSSGVPALFRLANILPLSCRPSNASKPLLPSNILPSVRSLRNKMDLWTSQVPAGKGTGCYRDICNIALSKNWLDESVSDAEVILDNFTIIGSNIRGQSGKMSGSEVNLHINKRWCKMCSPTVRRWPWSYVPTILPGTSQLLLLACFFIALSIKMLDWVLPSSNVRLQHTAIISTVCGQSHQKS